MVVRTEKIPVNGMMTRQSGMMTRQGQSDRSPGVEGGESPFGRLVEIVRENDELLGRLTRLGERLGQAREYAEDPLSNRSLATALVEHARVRHAAVLGRLRANREEAMGILRAGGQGAGSPN